MGNDYKLGVSKVLSPLNPNVQGIEDVGNRRKIKKEICPMHNSIKNNKFLGINVTKEVKDLYSVKLFWQLNTQIYHFAKCLTCFYLSKRQYMMEQDNFCSGM